MSERPLRVCVVGRSVYGLHGYGGLERHLYDLVRHHLADGHRVVLVTRPPADPATGGVDAALWDPLVRTPSLEIRYVKYRTFPFAGRRGTTVLDRSTAYPVFGERAGRVAADLVAAGEIDIVYGVGASVLGYARARRRRPPAAAPLVFNPQGLEEFGGPDGSYGGSRLKGLGYLPLRAAVRRIAAAADCVVATDRALQPMIRRQLGLPSHAVRLVPNGIDVAACDALGGRAKRDALRARLGLGPDEAMLLSVGRLERNKGFHDLAEALARAPLPARWRWVVVGDGPYRGELSATANASGIDGRLALAGRADDATLHGYYEAADLFVHPTRYEGSSLVTLEAMAHRLPVLATRAGGLPDKVEPGRTGWLTPPGRPDALAAALADAFASRDRWPAMGAAGRALLESTFDWRVIERQLTAVYRELLARSAGARE